MDTNIQLKRVNWIWNNQQGYNMKTLYPGHYLGQPRRQYNNTDYIPNSESFSIEFENQWCTPFETA